MVVKPKAKVRDKLTRFLTVEADDSSMASVIHAGMECPNAMHCYIIPLKTNKILKISELRNKV